VIKKAVLFDIDGTLLRAHGATERAFNWAFERLHAVADAAKGIPMSGRTDIGIIQDTAMRALGRELSNAEIVDRGLEKQCHRSHQHDIIRAAPAREIHPGLGKTL